MIWLRANERAIPAKIPAPRLTDADLNTIRSTSARSRAQRHTNPEFVGPLCHCVGHHAVQPYSGESQGEPGKNAKDPRCEMLLLPLGFISEASFEIIQRHWSDPG